MPGAQLIEYDGSAHGLFATDKQRLIDDLLAFLGGSGADQRSAIPLSQTPMAPVPLALRRGDCTAERGAPDRLRRFAVLRRPALRCMPVPRAFTAITCHRLAACRLPETLVT